MMIVYSVIVIVKQREIKLLKKETVLSGAEHPGTKLEAIHTNHGYYLGFRDEDGLPYSRETYYMPKTLAEAMLVQFREQQ